MFTVGSCVGRFDPSLASPQCHVTPALRRPSGLRAAPRACHGVRTECVPSSVDVESVSTLRVDRDSECACVQTKTSVCDELPEKIYITVNECTQSCY